MGRIAGSAGLRNWRCMDQWTNLPCRHIDAGKTSTVNGSGPMGNERLTYGWWHRVLSPF
jgi:hypothetical protein